MDATEVNWEPILEMLPTQDLEDYDERMKYCEAQARVRQGSARNGL